MPEVSSRKAVICFDGLNARQIDRLKKDMPLLSALLKEQVPAELDSAPFVDAQPIWAEILTGAPWYQNGCAGYAKPVRSLNSLQIFTERDLQKPIRLFEDNNNDGRVNVLINVPIVQSRENGRIWLADGAAPSASAVSPISLAQKPPFNGYCPRAVVSMGDAMANGRNAVERLLESEMNKLQCATTLAQETDWKFFLYRTSIFDHLSHLLGMGFLGQRNLALTPSFTKFLNELDKVVATVFQSASQRILLSTFSHIHCKGIFSVNDLLERSRLLARTDHNARENNLRLNALAAASGDFDQGTTLVNIAKTKQYLALKTLCASPVRGAIYVNTRNQFDYGGELDSSGMAREIRRIEEFLECETKRFGHSLKLFKNPEPELGGPTFVMQMDGIELVEAMDCISRNFDLPLSTHVPKGFVWAQNLVNATSLRAVDLVNFI